MQAISSRRSWTPIAGAGASATRSGQGPLLELPVNCESYNLTYVPDASRALRARRPADLGRVLRDGRGARKRVGRLRPRLRPARQGSVAHDVHRVREPDLVVRRPGLRRRPALRHREPRGRRADRSVHRRPAGRGAAGVDGAALVRARARLRSGPLRPDRRLRPLRRDLRGSRYCRRWPGRSATHRLRPAPEACSGRTSGPGRS